MTAWATPRSNRCLVGFGCGANAGLMVDAPEERRQAVVRAALAAGVDFFDTAPLYGRGASERNLGRALEACADDMETVDVYTKVSLAAEDLPDIRSAVLRSVEASLVRLRRRTLAGVTLHNRVATRRDTEHRVGAGPMLSVEDVLGDGGVVDALRDLVEDGVVASLGCTTLGGQRGAVEALLDSGAFGYVNAKHSILGTLDDGIADLEGADGVDVVGVAAERGHAVMALRVLGGGLLFGPGPRQEGYVRALERWCAEHRVGLARTALRYAMTDPRVTAVVLGFTEVEHVEEAVRAGAEGPLPPEECEAIGRLRAVALPS